MEIIVPKITGSEHKGSERAVCKACGYKFHQNGQDLCAVCERLIRLGVETLESLQAEAAAKNN
jgi:uncharacterized Zn finger protein (UPF0148 family)